MRTQSRARELGSIARTSGYLLREDTDRFLLLFDAAFGEYMWQQVARAAATLGGCPVGLDALPVLNAVHDA